MSDLKIDLKNRIISCLKERGRYTLPALANYPGIAELAEGDKHYGGDLEGEKANILYVKDVNTFFTSAIDELVEDGIIELKPVDLLAATVDGVVYNEYPIAEDVRVYPSTRWLPIDVRCGKNFPG